MTSLSSHLFSNAFKTVLCVPCEVIVTDEDIDDIMVSALEGGINYWCDNVEVVGEYLGEFASEQISRNGQLLLHYNETETVVLTKMKFMSGLLMYLKGPRTTAVLLDEGSKITLDCGNIDGNAADSIIQYAVFNDIIFA